MNLLTILLQASADGAEGEGGGMGMFVMLGLMFVIMWLFFIRPQAKKAKAATKFRNELSKGDKVVTIGGLHGKILDINDNTVLLQCEGAKLRVEKSAVSADNSASEQEVTAKS